MLNFTIEEQRALETSALTAARAIDGPDTTIRAIGGWEPALWTDFVTVLVNSEQSVAAIVIEQSSDHVDGDGNAIRYVELLGNDQMSFLVDQIHRCQAGALNGYRPAASVTV